MKKIITAAALLAIALSASAQNVSLSVGQPGFYGRIDLGNMSPPPVIYTQPVIVHRPVRVIEEPLYLRVPPGHAKKWSKHCGAYNACGRRVFFVRDDWYVNDYAPRYRSEHGRHERDARHDGRRDERHDDRHDGRRDHHEGKPDRHDNGPGHGRGHGKD